jgi:hypothetical protein
VEDVVATPGPVRALGLVLEPGRGWWCPLLVPMQHELTAHVTGCPMKAKTDTVEDWMTAMKATADTNGYWLNRLWPAFYGAAGVAI